MLTKTTRKVKTPLTTQQLNTISKFERTGNEKQATKRLTQQQLITFLPAEKTRNAKHLLLIKTMFVCSALFSKAKWIGLVVLGVGFSLVGLGQVYDGSYTVTSQADIDNFNYTEITGNLIIQNTDISNLNGFTWLERIGGDFRIEDNNNLITLDDFNQLGLTPY